MLSARRGAREELHRVGGEEMAYRLHAILARGRAESKKGEILARGAVGLLALNSENLIFICAPPVAREQARRRAIYIINCSALQVGEASAPLACVSCSAS